MAPKVDQKSRGVIVFSTGLGQCNPTRSKHTPIFKNPKIDPFYPTFYTFKTSHYNSNSPFSYSDYKREEKALIILMLACAKNKAWVFINLSLFLLLLSLIKVNTWLLLVMNCFINKGFELVLIITLNIRIKLMSLYR